MESVGGAVSPVITVSVPVASGGAGEESPVFVVAVESGIPCGVEVVASPRESEKPVLSTAFAVSVNSAIYHHVQIKSEYHNSQNHQEKPLRDVSRQIAHDGDDRCQ